MKITGILVDVYNKKIEPVTIEYSTDEEYYSKRNKLLKCSILCGKEVTFDGIECYCTFDDCGKLGDKELLPGVLLINKNNPREVVDDIVGNIWIERYIPEEYDTKSFTNNEIERILKQQCKCLAIHSDGRKEEVLCLQSIDDWIDFSPLINGEA